MPSRRINGIGKTIGRASAPPGPSQRTAVRAVNAGTTGAPVKRGRREAPPHSRDVPSSGLAVPSRSRTQVRRALEAGEVPHCRSRRSGCWVAVHRCCSGGCMKRATSYRQHVGPAFLPCHDCGGQVRAWVEQPNVDHNLAALYECISCGSVITLADWHDGDVSLLP